MFGYTVLMALLLAILFAIGNLEPEHSSVSLTEKAIYFAAGKSLASISRLAQCTGAICRIFPNGLRASNECLFFSDLCNTASRRLFTRCFKEKAPLFFHPFPLSQTSWRNYQEALSRIPTENQEEQELIHFLKRRYLAKGNGFIPILADWVCPFFGISVQTHPATSSAYARDPASHLSKTYQNRLESLAKLLPHPQEFPLILTRPENVSSYLPSCLHITKGEKAVDVIAKTKIQLQTNEKVVLDLTNAISLERTAHTTDWSLAWEEYRSHLLAACQDLSCNPDLLFCIQTIKREHAGGIRILPLFDAQSETPHRYLLEWVSHFGLTANMVELDRWLLSSYTEPSQYYPHQNPIVAISKEDFLSRLNSVEVEDNFMISASVNLLKGLFSSIPEEAWLNMAASKMKSAIIQFALAQIKEKFFFLEQKLPFFEAISHLEEIHTHLSSLLEIFSPFTYQDFSGIYRDLAPVPPKLQRLASYGLHASGMTSLAGIFQALEIKLGRKPSVLYGENSYFESIHAARWISKACSINEASEEQLQKADLLISQFHPVLQRIPHISEYSVENIAGTLRKALGPRRDHPLTLALDDTIDFIRSPNVYNLLSEFQQEIEEGKLNVICIHSPKFDLFGMDNYTGAPFFMIHSQDPKWDAFDLLISDPVLLTDHLSANWFCLAYKFAAQEEELYRKQIFDHTRSLLAKTPSRLFEQNRPYRIIPFQNEALPSFIDIRINGPFHKWRAAILIGWSIFTHSMEEKIPIFTRLSLGFYHPNFTVIFGEEDTTLRLTLGIDPREIDLFAKCFNSIEALNPPS